MRSPRSPLARTLTAAVGALAVACAPVLRPPASPLPASPPAQPGEQLRQVARSPEGLLAPEGWIDERSGLRGIWPALPAVGLRETWVDHEGASTVCREATWTGALRDVLRDVDPRVAALRDAATGDEQTQRASGEIAGARVTLREQRDPIGHEGSGGLYDPLTTLLVCIDGLDVATTARAAHDFVRAVPALAPTEGALDLEGVRILVAELSRSASGRDETEVSLVASAQTQQAIAAFLVEHRLAEPDPAVAWALDSLDPARNFVLYPPKQPENLVILFGRSP